jgi:hypothetical protein
MSFLEPWRSFSSHVRLGRRKQRQTVRLFVGMDVHKTTISISVAEDGRNGPVRFIGVIPNTAEAVTKIAKQPYEARHCRSEHAVI